MNQPIFFRKLYVCTAVMLATLLTATNAWAQTDQIFSGSGTETDPYLINNENDLRLLSDLSKDDAFYGKYFRLENDITMSDEPMLPIGTSGSGWFEGFFDGNDHTISNLHISEGTIAYTALFGITNKVISKLTLASCTITSTNGGDMRFTAGIVGESQGTISDCHILGGTISTTSPTCDHFGGIVGDNRGTVIDCTNSAALSMTVGNYERSAGGIVGYCGNNGTIKNCVNTGSISISGSGSGTNSLRCGGIVGYLYNGTVSSCANTGSISATSSSAYNYAGGVAGGINSSADAICIGNTNSGAVTTANGVKNYAGGIVSYYNESTYILKNNYYFGDCTVKGTAGWLSDEGDAPQSDVETDYGAVPGYAIVKSDELTLGSINGYDDVAHPACVAEGEVVTATYTHTIPAGTDAWTVCLPYNPPTGDGIKYYTLSGAKDAVLTFTEVSEPAANTPYLVVASESTDLGMENTEVDFCTDIVNPTAVDGFAFKGTLRGLDHAEAEGKYILKSDNQWDVADAADEYVLPFSAYIECEEGSQPMDTEFSDGTSGIDSIKTIDADGTEQWFDLNGHCIAKPTREGIYIHNGRKQIVK